MKYKQRESSCLSNSKGIILWLIKGSFQECWIGSIIGNLLIECNIVKGKRYNKACYQKWTANILKSTALKSHSETKPWYPILLFSVILEGFINIMDKLIK